MAPKTGNHISLKELLKIKGIDPNTVLVMRHQPKEPDLRKVFPRLAANRPDLFKAYQSSHFMRQEKQLAKAAYLASFIGNSPGKALFICLFKNGGFKPITRKQFWNIRENKELRSLGMAGFSTKKVQSVLWFNLILQPAFSDWKGRLVIDWPGGERSWSRWASANEFLVEAIAEKFLVEPPMPSWYELLLDWADLKELWPSWQAQLKFMRGIYFIFDKSAGKGYVGSACGVENMLGRWKNYAQSGHGGNKLLRRRDPNSFCFSVLELVSPALPRDEVIKKEQSWKRRLSTIAPNGLNEM